ncbi:sel1 repeat family protein [Actinospica durhamensis]|uniref:Sel1 repeat family protein n=1 Tax=Actinospica durhamensis TaxID=1508375 RepID=A0A941EQT7_9ACTN|nr:tetratricopeptide repeat protein [Actinospica durhamensis]MBR7835681.1 sel1 repeat family protein [Actinospica durhamensis]
MATAATAGLAAVGGVFKLGADLLKDAYGDRAKQRLERSKEVRELADNRVGPDGELLLVRDAARRELLGIHEATRLPVEFSDPSLDPELPTYVTRDIDADLHTALKAATRTGGLFLLVGAAATGKTRCAFEAIRTVVPEWKLLLPSDAGEVRAHFKADVDLGRTVVWLNDVQLFLGVDGLRSAEIRRVLADVSRPVLFVGTMWNSTYEELTASDGMRRDAKTVLGMARRFPVVAFSESEWSRAEQLQAVDPRLAEAIRFRIEGTLPQTLASRLALIHRWAMVDDAYAASVMVAAMNARLCGVSEVLPAGLHERLAASCLSGEARATAEPDWFAKAVEWACRPVQEATSVGILSAVGVAIGETVGWRISDMLVDYAVTSGWQVSDEFWRLIMAEVDIPACVRAGFAAYNLGRTDLAEEAWRRSADAGDDQGMFNLAVALTKKGDPSEGEVWYRRSAESGNGTAMYNLAFVCLKRGDAAEAERWFRRSVEVGTGAGMNGLGWLLFTRGDSKEAEGWFRGAADAGYINGLANLGVVFECRGEEAEAELWHRRAAEAGDREGMFNLACMLDRHGETNCAATWFQRAAEAGIDPWSEGPS